MTNLRTLAYPALALAVMGALVLLVPQPEETGGQALPRAASPPAVERDRRFRFVYPIELPQPEESVTRNGFVADRVQRWFDRALWAPPSLVTRTDELLERLDADERRRYTALVGDLWQENRILAARMLPGLGRFDDAAAQALILDACLDTSAYVRNQAVLGLVRMDGPGAALRAEGLLSDPDESVRRAAVRALIEMDDKEALAALRRYAATDPEDGLAHVLLRLGQATDDPGFIPELRRHADAPGKVGIIALEALAKLGDPVAIDRIYLMLESPDAGERARAISDLRQAPNELIDVGHLAPLVADRQPEVRRVTAEFLVELARSGASDAARIEELFDRMLDDADLRVHRATLTGLYALGRRDLAEPFLKEIGFVSGQHLHDVVDLVAFQFGDERAPAVMRSRFASHPDPNDAATLLSGLAHMPRAEDVDLFVDLLRAAGPDEPIDAHGTTLSEHAALRIRAYGEPARDAILAELAAPQAGEHATLRLLDALRGLAEPGSAEAVLAVAVDATRSQEVRKAAIETLAFLPDEGIHDRLLAVRDGIDTYDLGQTAKRVLFDHL